jgi:hypothetical protein
MQVIIFALWTHPQKSLSVAHSRFLIIMTVPYFLLVKDGDMKIQTIEDFQGIYL